MKYQIIDFEKKKKDRINIKVFVLKLKFLEKICKNYKNIERYTKRSDALFLNAVYKHLLLRKSFN